MTPGPHGVGVVFVALLAGCGSSARDSAVGSDPCGTSTIARSSVVGGQLTASDPSVGALVNAAAEPCKRAGLPVCAATIIGPRSAVTAAHCFLDRPEDYALLLASDADQGPGPVGEGLDGAWYPVESVRIHPSYPDDPAWDVAVMHFADSVPVDPMPVSNGTEVSDDALLDAPVRVIGYGLSEGLADFRKRTGGVAITEIGPLELTYEPAPAMTCDGDSGGPVLAEVAGSERLVAITSRGDPDCAVYGVGVRTSAVHDFLVSP